MVFCNHIYCEKIESIVKNIESLLSIFLKIYGIDSLFLIFSKIDHSDSIMVALFKRSTQAIWSWLIFLKDWQEQIDPVDL